MFQFAELMTCQKPEKSGLPSDVRGIEDVEAVWLKTAAGKQIKKMAASAASRIKRVSSLNDLPRHRGFLATAILELDKIFRMTYLHPPKEIQFFEREAQPLPSRRRCG